MGMALYNILIKPIEIFIEIVFNVMNLAFRSPGVAIIFVSIAVQLLCFPLYKRADAIQEQERQKQKDMKHWLDHIKMTFKGDERFMMQQTYYRLVGYKPIYAIKGSISLLLQIPFFIAAYDFLSNLEALNSASFFMISDLSQPDGLIRIGTLTLNLLPILMTLFNIISGVIYTKGFPLKDKIQTYGLACIFLVLLYQSPSGLVFYWTLNNVFSLIKNIFQKIIKNPAKVIRIMLLTVGVISPIYVIFFSGRAIALKLLTCVFAVVCILPTIVTLIKRIPSKREKRIVAVPKDVKIVNSVFYTSITAIFVFIALVIPVNVIKSSPVEFISVNYGPFGLIFRVACIFIGFLYVWINIFYILSTEKIKKVFSIVTCVVAVIFPINYFFFAKNLGIISPYFIYDHNPKFSVTQYVINLLVVAVIALIVIIINIKKTQLIKNLYRVVIITFAITAVIGMVSIERNLASEGHPERHKVSEKADVSDEQIIELSKKGKNVVVLMLDRAISSYLPYILDEKPELTEKFDGFTYYPNTLSFGGSTNLGSPAIFGGYEYTPDKINERKNESLEKKQNEALTVMPKLFLDNGYKVTVCDPPYAGYKFVPDLSIYDEYDGINAYITMGAYSDSSKLQYSSLFETSQTRNFVFYCFMKSMPVFTQNIIYQNGVYWSSDTYVPLISVFLDSYTVLEKFNKLTKISDDSENTFFMMRNNTTHDPILLEEPDYTPSADVSFPDYRSKTSKDGKVMDLSSEEKMTHYQAHMCAMLRIGEWLDYLREQGVYDNTRIIIVSDHGKDIDQFEGMRLSNGVNVLRFNPLFMVKDFNSKGFTTSDEFMTNADTPTLAIDGLIDNAINPFTNKAINNSAKTDAPQLITTTEHFAIVEYHGNTFDTSDGEWWAVSENIFDENNWKKVGVK